MAVITLSREFGSEGNAIGIKIAEILKYRCVFKQDIDAVFLKYGMEILDNLQFPTSHRTRYDQTIMQNADFLSKVVMTMAKQGNIVIVGRCGFSILKEFNDVLHIRIKAPLAVKAARIGQENLTTEDKVETYIKEQDENRVMLLENLYDTDWYNAQPFNMVLDTEKIRPDRAVAWIVETARKLENENIAKEYTTQSIKIDPLLENIVTQVLAQSVV